MRSVPAAFVWSQLTSSRPCIHQLENYQSTVTWRENPSDIGIKSMINKRREKRMISMEMTPPIHAMDQSSTFVTDFVSRTLSMVPDMDAASTLDILTNAALKNAQLAQDLSDPEVEATLLSDLSNIFLDIIAFLNPVTSVARLAAVLGRAVCVAGEYLPEQHSVLPEEAALNSAMLVTSMVLLFNSAWPLVGAFFAQTNIHDKTVFEQLFEPVGVSWLQFKSLKAAGAIEWEEVGPGTVLVCENEVPRRHSLSLDENDGILTDNNEETTPPSFLYWLYKGEVQLSFQGYKLKYVERNNGKSIDDAAALGLLADMRCLYELDSRRIQKLQRRRRGGRKVKKDEIQDPRIITSDEFENQNRNEESESSSGDEINKNYPMATVVSGSKGATVLKVNSEKISNLMDHDDQLSESVSILLLKSSQRKVGHLLRCQEEISKRTIQTQNIEMEIQRSISSETYHQSRQRALSGSEHRSSQISPDNYS